MKEIRAYVHRNRIADLIQALKQSEPWKVDATQGGHNLTVYAVKGSLLATHAGERRYSIELADEVIDEYKLELISEDDQVESLVHIIRQVARTGQASAGWIYVTDIVQAVPID